MALMTYNLLIIITHINIIEFRKEGVGHNCPTTEIIENRAECAVALKALGIDQTDLHIDQANRPAGCYWKTGLKGYFNSIVDPSSTDPTLFGDRGGVCNNVGKNHEYIK